MERKLPVYLLLDTSSSMSGEPIQAVQTGVDTMLATLRQDPYALETAWLSIITFDSSAQQTTPLTELSSCQAPTLNACGCTALGAALALVAECAEREVQKTTADTKGDWKPLVFIMTDGQPTDNFQHGLSEFKQYKFGMVIACAAGQDADINTLKQITEIVVQLDTADSATFQAFFKWVSASVSSTSMRVTGGSVGSGGLASLPPPPAEVNVII